MLAAYQFCQVERESIGIENTESFGTIELGLAVGFQFIHSGVEHADALVKGA